MVPAPVDGQAQARRGSGAGVHLGMTAQDNLHDFLRGVRDGYGQDHPGPPILLSRPTMRMVFALVEAAYAEGGWDALEAAIAAVPEFADPMGSLGPLWIAIETEAGREVRAAIEFVEVAKDVRHNLNKFGRMRPVELT